MPKIVDSWLESEVGGLAGRCPDAAAEPVARNVVVAPGGARDAGKCAALGAPLGAVAGEGASAMLAAAPSRRVSAERGMPVLAALLVRLSHAESARIGHHPQLPRWRAASSAREHQIAGSRLSPVRPGLCMALWAATGQRNRADRRCRMSPSAQTPDPDSSSETAQCRPASYVIAEGKAVLPVKEESRWSDAVKPLPAVLEWLEKRKIAVTILLFAFLALKATVICPRRQRQLGLDTSRG